MLLWDLLTHLVGDLAMWLILCLCSASPILQARAPPELVHLLFCFVCIGFWDLLLAFPNLLEEIQEDPQQLVLMPLGREQEWLFPLRERARARARVRVRAKVRAKARTRAKYREKERERKKEG